MAVAEGVMLDEAALAELEGTFRGDVVPTTHSSYDEHRKIWNGSIDRHPALIARCAGVADVISAVKFGRNDGVAGCGAERGTLVPGTVCRRRRVDDRPLADEGRARRS